jgi:hypothetical protein
MCRLSAIKTRSFRISWPFIGDRIVIPKHRNGITTYAAYNPRRRKVSKHVQFQCFLPSGECQMVEYKCVLLYYLKKMSSRVKLNDLPGQGIDPAIPTQHLCCMFKSFFIPKHHHTWDFQLLVPLKQNPQTEMHQLAVTANILSHPGVQLCVESVALHSWQRDLFSWGTWKTSRACSTFRSHLNKEHSCDLPVIRKILKLHYGTVWTHHPASKCVFSNKGYCPLHAVQYLT